VNQGSPDYRNIFDASPDPIVITRVADSRILLVNEEFIRASGYTREEALGHTAIELNLWPDPAQRQRCFKLLQATGELRNVAMTFQSKHGEQRPFLISAGAVWFNGEPCSMTVSRDVTEMQKIQAELVAAREAAEAASLAKSEFLSSMSHEIRTPMNAILGVTELLAETQLDDQQVTYLALMRTNGTALLTLINDILDLAKVESGRLSLEDAAFNLAKLVASVMDTLAARAGEKQLAMTTRMEPDVARHLVGDPLRLRQILINLVGNAIKFTERGQVVLSVANEAGGEPGMLHFSISDTGIGIPQDMLGYVFSEFTQADSSTARRYGGSGLGLAIVKRLVELMSGRVWVESRVGVGSTFHFTARLRVAEESIANQSIEPSSITLETPRPELLNGASKPKVPSAREVVRNGTHGVSSLRILVVDDSVDNRFLLKAFLKRHPYAIDEAENGLAAVKKFTANSYDVVLMDMQMPVMDGYTAVQTIREWERQREVPATPIVALTASALRGDVAKCIAAGCDLHVSKPVDKATLLEALRRTTSKTESPAAASAGADQPET
jgi:PAS domain S-box-containing protein